jgi:hypothetical protein
MKKNPFLSPFDLVEGTEYMITRIQKQSFFVNCAIYIVLFEKINFFKKIISKMAVLAGLVGLASKYAAFRRPGGVPVVFQGGAVLLISVSTYGASKIFFYYLCLLKSTIWEGLF